MALCPPVTATPVKSAAELPKFVNVIAEAFSDDALTRYLRLGLESRPDHPKLQSLDFGAQYWAPIVQTRFEQGGILLQANDFEAVALWSAARTFELLPLVGFPDS